MTDMDVARAQAVNEFSSAMLIAAGDALIRHGDNDPHALAILLAGLSMFIDQIDKNIVPGFRRATKAMLETDHA